MKYLIAIILFILLLFAATRLYAAPATIELTVCLTCSVYYCNDCPFTAEHQAVIPYDQQVAYVMQLSQQESIQQYCDNKEMQNEYMPDFCFNLQKVD